MNAIFELIKSILAIFLSKKENILPDDEDADVEKISKPDVYEEVSKDLGMEPELLKAFIKVESGKTNTLNGRPICRWETHIFKRYTNITINVHGMRGKITEECQNNEYEAYERGCSIEEGKYADKAQMSASWGMGQIMGFHYKRLGFSTPKALIDYIAASDDNSLRAIGKFIKTNAQLLKACQEKDFHNIAKFYNGAHYEKYAPEGKQYDDKIKIAYEQLKA